MTVEFSEKGLGSSAPSESEKSDDCPTDKIKARVRAAQRSHLIAIYTACTTEISTFLVVFPVYTTGQAFELGKLRRDSNPKGPSQVQHRSLEITTCYDSITAECRSNDFTNVGLVTMGGGSFPLNSYDTSELVDPLIYLVHQGSISMELHPDFLDELAFLRQHIESIRAELAQSQFRLKYYGAVNFHTAEPPT
ncbi:hypothetical protein BKA67DRAFT_542542 [Truncatella angustata]|uniref:Uncharacterized protein n=1 Tax=Truncatella angustata TaxID=152316 RepID=A0A9P8RJM4_9PEZI|nr:uncharacterized protein BKA67DRAFT_542542 [Truncatella angustata]KAH6640015.1 hypothetical protein BKA67DRAFT_542542 [Truncatella angustata]